MVCVAGLRTGMSGNAPTAMAAGAAAQPAVCRALQVAVLITRTVPASASSEAYRVCVAWSIAPTLDWGSGVGISATGAHPEMLPGWQVAVLITSIRGSVTLPP